MVKQNYSRSEKAASEGMHAIQVNRLLELADAASGKKDSDKEKQGPARQLIKIIKQKLRWLHKGDPNIYKTLDIKISSIKKLEAKSCGSSEPLDDEDIETLKTWIAQIAEYKKKRPSTISDEKIVEAEYEKHLNKRHNVNERWLPLR